MKVLVTGGAGFIGFHVSQALLERGDQVVIVDNFNDYYDPKLKEARIVELKKSGKFDIYRVDISNLKEMEFVFKKHNFDKICHLAAQAGVRYSLENPFIYEQTNNLGTLNLLELARINKVNHFVYASSSSVYGANTKIPFSEDDDVSMPISLYAATKRCNELYAYTYHHLYGIKCTGLRFFTVYGPWGRPDMAYFKFTKNIFEGKPIDVYNDGKMKRDFTYISDIVIGILAALDKPFEYEIFNLGNNNPIKITEFIAIIENVIEIKSKTNFLKSSIKTEVPITYANIEKAKKFLNFTPQFSLEKGLNEFIEWYKIHS